MLLVDGDLSPGTVCLVDPAGLAAQRAVVDATLDPGLPVWDHDPIAFGFALPDDAAGGGDGDSEGLARQEFERACRDTGWSLKAAAAATDADPARVRVMARWITHILPLIPGLAPRVTKPEHAPLQWARVRCFLGGLGFAAHAALATCVRDLWPDADLDPAETRDQWASALIDAHTTCGWPAVLGLLPWSATCAATLGGADDADAPGARQWVMAVGGLHLMKYLRAVPSRGHLLAVFNGRLAWTDMSTAKTSRLPITNRQEDSMCAALALAHSFGTKRAPKRAPIVRAAAFEILSMLSMSSLLTTKPVDVLPPSVFTGPWSSPAPRPQVSDQFFQTGYAPTGVWYAAPDGRIEDAVPDASDVLDYAWKLEVEGASDAARRAYRSVLPDTYDASAWPSDLLLEYFPHIDMHQDKVKDGDAYLALLDAFFVLNCMRSDERMPIGTGREFPLLLVCPSHPTPEGSTNQGKTTLARVCAHAFAAGAPTVRAAETGSVVDNRPVAEILREFGTAVIDEFRLPVGQGMSSLLNRQNLQSLCTGDTIAAGRVGQNSEGTVRLRSSLAVSTKAADFPDDIMNRSLPIWLGPMPEQARTDVQRATDLGSGRLSILLRLAAYAKAIGLGLLEDPASLPVGSQGVRFPVWAGLAARIMRDRFGVTIDDATARVSACGLAVFAELQRHATQARESGADTDHAGALAVMPLFDRLADEAVAQIAQAIAHAYPGPDYGVRISTLLSRISAVVLDDDLPGRELYRRLVGGIDGRMTERAFLLAFGRGLRLAFPAQGDSIRITDTHWRLVRAKDNGTGITLRIAPIVTAGAENTGL
jgi:hypothetical protein